MGEREGSPAPIPGCLGAARLEVGPATLITEDNGTISIQLLFDGESFVLLVQSIVQGKQQARAVFIDASGQPGSIVFVTSDGLAGIDSAHAVHSGGRTWVTLVRDGVVYVRTLGPSGELSDAQALVADPATVSAVMHRAGEDFDVELRGLGGTVPRAVRVDASGAPVAGPQPLFAETPSDGYTYEFHWLWPDRVLRIHGVPPEPFTLSLSTFGYGAAPSPGTAQFVTAGPAHSSDVLAGDPTLVGIYDTDLGARVLELEADGAKARYDVPVTSGQRPRLAPDGDCGFALLVDHGTFSDDNAATTDLGLHLVDREYRRIAPVAALPVAPGVCLEGRHQIAAGPRGTFGVAWIETCNGTRRIQFAIVRATPVG